ncbi:glutamate 5-kinase [Filifactor alocis]|uniref:glutamate 5-kinase n=1 Tax=Filifactor alocis TaxID=143361 RepID=UPI0028D74BCC|nr:glutamate 5-kinase [Filifactor alocis]
MSKKAKRVVVKLGSSSLTYENGKLNLIQIEQLVRQIADLKNQGHDVLVVSSGAISAGMGYLNYSKRPKTLPEKQACAAIGQGKLLHLYEKLFCEYGYSVGQILLTKEDFADRERFLNSRSVLNELLSKNIIPIINENDAVVVSEIKFGDNDTLSALVSTLIEADLLIILSDIDGLFDKNPQVHKDAKLIEYVEKIDSKIESLAGDSISNVGTGGMRTKINAAKIATRSGISVIIAKSNKQNVLNCILNGQKIGTFFVEEPHQLKLRKSWIAYNARGRGQIVIDLGAYQAIENNKSLLPSGIIEVRGEFRKGDVVDILFENKIIGRGLTYFDYDALNKIKGKHSEEIEDIIGTKDYDEVIHKDNLVRKEITIE